MSKELVALFVVLLLVLVITKTYLDLSMLKLCIYLVLYYFLKMGVVLIAQMYVKKAIRNNEFKEVI